MTSAPAGLRLVEIADGRWKDSTRNDEILRNLGFTDHQLADLRARQVVGEIALNA